MGFEDTSCSKGSLVAPENCDVTKHYPRILLASSCKLVMDAGRLEGHPLEQSGNHTVQNRNRFLVVMLRAMGLLDLFALLAVIAPRTWISASHQWLGMGDFPNEPIAGYLARSTSIWYAAYGLLLWFVSTDVGRYSPLIRCLAWMMIAQGIVIIGVDVAEKMPTWWTALEGPCSAGLGIGLLMLHRWTFER